MHVYGRWGISLPTCFFLEGGGVWFCRLLLSFHDLRHDGSDCLDFHFSYIMTAWIARQLLLIIFYCLSEVVDAGVDHGEEEDKWIRRFLTDVLKSTVPALPLSLGHDNTSFPKLETHSSETRTPNLCHSWVTFYIFMGT